MAKASKQVRRAKKARKSKAPIPPQHIHMRPERIRTLGDMMDALGGEEWVSWHLYGDRGNLINDPGFRSGVVPRGFGLQIFTSLLNRGYTREMINPKLFDHPTWRHYTVPQRRTERHP